IMLYVDDAHGSGLLDKGAGTVEHFGLQDKVDFQIDTLSQAIDVVGGYVAGSPYLIDWLTPQSRPFLFSYSLAPVDTTSTTESATKLVASTYFHEDSWKK
ncbi:aminotransferase class I/II-fold pyridoxal phosphate-dependent enzyme, partial [Staphylococcus pseudintermedius]|uniref:aminotransferase class I/II-fold pyridoxal phosphate-dependent enzyme n=1 Tax=Staphylococcus pseudintermedius TaxID=283734 RepID=UPI000E36F367